MKKVILSIPHYDCERSARIMFRAAGYEVYGIGDSLRSKLQESGHHPCGSSIRPSINTLKGVDIFVAIKHWFFADLAKTFPELRCKMLWWDINGGTPGRRIPKPYTFKEYPESPPVPYVSPWRVYDETSSVYRVYPPPEKPSRFVPRSQAPRQTPICLVHNVSRWGFGWLAEQLTHDIQMHGGHSPAGFLSPGLVPERLSETVAYVHIKSRDCPGYALYWALLAGTPIVLMDAFLRRTQFTDLYEPDRSCVVVDTSDRTCAADNVREAIGRIKRNPRFGVRIGEEGRRRARELLWNPKRSDDVERFTKFLAVNFG